MSLSQDPVFNKLRSRYVCGYRDITGLSYAGKSGRHEVDGQAFLAKNGAGPHNIQLFIMAPDGTVLHCLPGYWDPRDLAEELALAEQIYRIHQRQDLSAEQKAALFRNRQLSHQHSPAMTARSHMEKFDMKFEARKRARSSDTFVRKGATPLGRDGRLDEGAFKTTDVLLHERMAKRPFVPYEQFDVATFSDYGRPKYDKKEDERRVRFRR